MCLLCDIVNNEKKMYHYYDGKGFIICECDKCNEPMAILKKHAVEYDGIVLRDMINNISRIAMKKWQDKWYIDMYLTECGDHFHLHARQKKEE
jgi:hypothetical protein